MGVGIRISGGDSFVFNRSNPNPKLFNIIRQLHIGGLSVLLVKYDGCTNYEGKKVLVIEGYEKSKTLDPHFTEGEKNKVIARFEPTESGWDNAIMFVKMLTERRK